MKHSYAFDRKAGDQAFFLTDGDQLTTIKELYTSLDTMEDEIFAYHLERNDFSSWVREVFGEQQLATRLSHTSTKKEFKRVLGDWISTVIHENYNARKKKDRKAVKAKVVDERFVFNELMTFIMGLIVGVLSTLVVLKIV